jgi:hypothetical protein
MSHFPSDTAEKIAYSLCRMRYECGADVGYVAAHLLARYDKSDWKNIFICLLSYFGTTELDQPPPEHLNRMTDDEWERVKKSIGARLEHILETLLDGHLEDENAAEFLAEQLRDMADNELAVALAIILDHVAPYEYLPDELFGDEELVDTVGIVLLEIKRVARQLTMLSYRQDISVTRLWKVALFLISALDVDGTVEMLAYFHELVPRQYERVGDPFAEYSNSPFQQVLYLSEDRVYGGDAQLVVVRGKTVESAVASWKKACFHD